MQCGVLWCTLCFSSCPLFITDAPGVQFRIRNQIRSHNNVVDVVFILPITLCCVLFCFDLICFGLFCGSVLFVQCLHCPLLSSVYFFVLCLKSKSRNRNYHRTTNSLVVSLPYRVSTHALHLLHSDCIRERRQRRRCGWEIQWGTQYSPRAWLSVPVPVPRRRRRHLWQWQCPHLTLAVGPLPAVV